MIKIELDFSALSYVLYAQYNEFAFDFMYFFMKFILLNEILNCICRLNQTNISFWYKNFKSVNVLHRKTYCGVCKKR